MRVIAGTAGGTRLVAVPAGVRPLSDRAREGLFSSLGPAVGGARVLDLYAGTGALGIEALSRGAAEALFVDRSPAALRAVRENLARTRLGARARAVRAEVLTFLRRRGERGFDLCFLDPPYDVANGEVEAVLGALAKGWLAPGFTACLTRSKRAPTPVIPVDWRLAKRLSYGDTVVLVLREA